MNSCPAPCRWTSRKGSYGLAITLTVIGAILASILPARAAARVDPVSGDRAMTTLLDVHDLVKTFGEGEAATHVLRGLSLTLQSGELAALLGPSGSGKSTLLTILGTLMKPTSGHYRMLGTDLVAADDAALTEFRNRHIGFVFQFHNLLPDFTALENVIFPTAVREGRETPAARARGRALLVRMGLEERTGFLATKTVWWPEAARCRRACLDEQPGSGSGR